MWVNCVQLSMSNVLQLLYVDVRSRVGWHKWANTTWLITHSLCFIIELNYNSTTWYIHIIPKNKIVLVVYAASWFMTHELWNLKNHSTAFLIATLRTSNEHHHSLLAIYACILLIWNITLIFFWYKYHFNLIIYIHVHVFKIWT